MMMTMTKFACDFSASAPNELQTLPNIVICAVGSTYYVSFGSRNPKIYGNLSYRDVQPMEVLLVN